jgi:hypothetical protein
MLYQLNALMLGAGSRRAPFTARPPHPRFERCTPRQLRACLGFPMPGDPLWTPAFTAAMAHRYPGFDPGPYDRARGGAGTGLGEAELELAGARALRAEVRRLRAAL